MAVTWVFIGILVTMCMTQERGRQEQGYRLPLRSLKTESARIASPEHCWDLSEVSTLGVLLSSVSLLFLSRTHLCLVSFLTVWPDRLDLLMELSPCDYWELAMQLLCGEMLLFSFIKTTKCFSKELDFRLKQASSSVL